MISNYKLLDLVLDEICHWALVVDDIFGIYVVIKRPVREVSEDIMDDYFGE